LGCNQVLITTTGVFNHPLPWVRGDCVFDDHETDFVFFVGGGSIPCNRVLNKQEYNRCGC
jgi:hypothetical protein